MISNWIVFVFCCAGAVFGTKQVHKFKYSVQPDSWPLVVTTWAGPGFQNATDVAWRTLQQSHDRLEAVVAGCSACEIQRCDETVGYGGSPDEIGETTLDALIMDGPGHRMGAVSDLRRVKNASRVALAVMTYTKHSFLVGESAKNFAVEMGFEESDLHTNSSAGTHIQWKTKNKCQPNFRINVTPDPTKHCGPYKPNTDHIDKTPSPRNIDRFNHDTIGMVVIDQQGDIAVGTSTNGASFKIPGRVSDSALPGAGAYVDNSVGGAAATGDGDIMMRFVPSYQAVEGLRMGHTPQVATRNAMRRIIKYYRRFNGAVIAADKKGRHGAACHGIGSFTYSFFDKTSDKVQTRTEKCI